MDFCPPGQFLELGTLKKPPGLGAQKSRFLGLIIYQFYFIIVIIFFFLRGGHDRQSSNKANNLH